MLYLLLFRGDNERTSIQEVTLRHFDDLQHQPFVVLALS